MRRHVRLGTGVLVALMLPMPLWSCGGGDGPPPGDREGIGSLPAGFQLRLDRTNRDPADFEVSMTGDRLLVRTGPAGIVYQNDDVVESGDYSISATITEVEAPRGHREGMGIFIGGQALQGSGQRYTYFLVRADGSYLIKLREGDETANVTENWRESEAVNAASGVEDVTNALRVAVEGGTLLFAVNDTEVHRTPVGDLPVYGAFGLRVNHNLRVSVDGFGIRR